MIVSTTVIFCWHVHIQCVQIFVSCIFIFDAEMFHESSAYALMRVYWFRWSRFKSLYPKNGAGETHQVAREEKKNRNCRRKEETARLSDDGTRGRGGSEKFKKKNFCWNCWKIRKSDLRKKKLYRAVWFCFFNKNILYGLYWISLQSSHQVYFFAASYTFDGFP